jgi:hypothetical protein
MSNAQVLDIRNQLEQNPRIKAVFGNLKLNQRETGEDGAGRWREDEFQTSAGVTLIARGRGGQVRGTIRGSERPSFIFVDDVEDEDSVNTEEQRIKCRRWLYEAVMPALPSVGRKGRLVLAATMLHREAVAVEVQKDPEWNSCVFGAVDKDGDPLWKANKTKEQLEAKRRSYARVGMVAGFYREYMSQLRDDESALFNDSMFKINPRRVDEMDIIVGTLDPAISRDPNRKGSMSAFSVVGLSERLKILHIFECFGRRMMTPSDQIDMVFELVKRYNLKQFGIEAIAYQAALVHLLKEEMFERGIYFEVVEIRHVGNKDGVPTKKEPRIQHILHPRS